MIFIRRKLFMVSMSPHRHVGN